MTQKFSNISPFIYSSANLDKPIASGVYVFIAELIDRENNIHIIRGDVTVME